MDNPRNTHPHTPPDGNTRRVELLGVVYCGDGRCHGACGLPAAYLDADGVRYYLRGAMTATGTIMQAARQHPDGPSVDLGGILTADEAVEFMRMWWSP